MPQPNDPNLVAKALAKAQSVEGRLNAYIGAQSEQTGTIQYSGSTTVVSQNANGQYTWTCPAGVTSVMVECWGAGAGGGGGNPSEGGEAGGGGAYAAEASYAVTPGNVYTYVVGAGGTGGTTNHVGLSGGDSYFDPNGSGVYAFGGQAGGQGTGGSGGTTGGNTVTFAGGAGSGTGGQSTGGCGAGSSASPTANGNNGAGNSTGTTGTAGGAGGTDQGAGGAGGNNTVGGNNGSSPGGGGGGAGASAGATQVQLVYQPTSSATYYGSDAIGGNANNKATTPDMYQSGINNGSGVYNGTMKSLMIWPSSIQSDLSGVTVDQILIKLKNIASNYSTVTILLGYTAKTSLPSSWDGTGATHTNSFSVPEFSYGGNGFDITGSTLATALGNGTARSFYMGLGSQYDLTKYGSWKGATSTSHPVLTINGHTGAGSVTAGKGADGQVRITYTVASANIQAAVQPVAGTDGSGNQYVAGLSGQAVLMYGRSTPATPASGNVVAFGHSTGGGMDIVNNSGLTGTLVPARTNRQTFTANNGSSNPVTATYSIPANDVAVGTIFRLKVAGVGTYTSGSAQDLHVNVAGTDQATTRMTSLPATFIWTAEAELIIASTGVSGTAYMRCQWNVSQASAAWTIPLVVGMTGGTSGTTVTVDTTSALDMKITSSMNGTSSVTGLWSTFERLGA